MFINVRLLACHTSIKQNGICADIPWLKSRDQWLASVNMAQESAGNFLS